MKTFVSLAVLLFAVFAIGFGKPRTSLSTIDFGLVNVQSTKDTTLQIMNTDSYSIQINSMVLVGQDADKFAIKETNFPYTLNPAQDKSVIISFSPTNDAAVTSDLIINYTDAGVDSTLIVNLAGQGVSLIVSGSVDSAHAGSQVTFNVSVEGITMDALKKFASGFIAALQYNKNVLVPVDQEIPVSYIDNMASFKVKGDIGDENILYSIGFKIKDEAKESTQITISSFKWIDKDGNELEYPVSIKSGFVKNLDEKGVDDEQSSQNPNDELRISPNPAMDFITFTFSEDNNPASNAVEIVDMLGARIISLKLENTGSQKMDISNLPPGIYCLRVGKLSKLFIKN